MTAPLEPIEDYLDELLGRLHGTPASVRRMLGETEQHLYAAAEDGVAAGLAAEAAARRAVDRFGPVSDVARAWNDPAPAHPGFAWARGLAVDLVPLVGVGLLAIGLSGVVARVMTSMWGVAFVFADAPGTTYPAASCSYWMSIHPAARSCTQAYMDEALADGLLARYAAGVLGIVILVVVAALRRRRIWEDGPSQLVSMTGAAVFFTAALGLVALGADTFRFGSGDGAGQWLSGAAVALPLAVAFGLVLLRSERRQVNPPSL